MVLNIKSEMDYDIKVNVNDNRGSVIQSVLPEHGDCQMSVDTNDKVRIFIDTPEENIAGKFFSTFMEVLLNFFFFCFSVEGAKSIHLIGNTGNYINLMVKAGNECCIDIVYKTVKVLYSDVEINLGIVENTDEGVRFRYEIDREQHYQEYNWWMKQNLLFLIPGLTVLMIGIALGVIQQNYVCVIFFAVLSAVFGYAGFRFITNSRKMMEEQLEALIKWAERFSH